MYTTCWINEESQWLEIKAKLKVEIFYQSLLSCETAISTNNSHNISKICVHMCGKLCTRKSCHIHALQEPCACTKCIDENFHVTGKQGGMVTFQQWWPSFFPSIGDFFEKKILEDISPFHGATDTPMLDFW